ncbi:MAG: hypothetical protein B7Z74_05855 [Deltaproteobacteria bacterium 21-66-5]|nr:MAG: hypothetical protein B7Z74_05855 [Deltaproteobacteria bacterium 21-66-5]
MANEQAAEKIEATESSKVKISIIRGMDVFKVKVVDIDKCTICMACELRCPDFAIFVEKK